MKQNAEVKEILPSELGNRDIIRANSTKAEEIVKIELSKLIIRENFNVREDYGDLEGLANSILENGQVQPGIVDVMADGTFGIVEGHRRYFAMKILQDRGHTPLFRAVVNGKKITEEQRILQMFATQDNKQLTPHEVAELIKRLINLGYNQSEVAVKIGKSAAYVSQMLEYANESPEIKKHVKEGSLTVAAALQVKKAIPSQTERVAAVNEAVSNKGEARTVTAEQVTNKKANRIDTITDALYDLFQSGETVGKELIALTLRKYIK